MSACWPLVMPSTAKAVLISLADNANDLGECWPSIDTIGRRTCLHRASVIRAIAVLEKLGHVVANRTNGRRTRYFVTPNLGLFEPTKPVVHSAGSQSASTRSQRPDLSQRATRPVAERDTNRKEASRTVERENARPRDADRLPDGVDPERWAAYCAQAEVDGKLSAPRLLTATGQLGALAQRGVDCNAVLEAAVMRGLRDLTDVARRLQDESRRPQPRRGPANSVGKSSTRQAMEKLLEIGNDATRRLDHERDLARAGEAAGAEAGSAPAGRLGSGNPGRLG